MPIFLAPFKLINRSVLVYYIRITRAIRKLKGIISTPQRYKNHWKIEIFLSIKFFKDNFVKTKILIINNITAIVENI